MPVHSHDRPKRLEPKRITEARKQLRWAVVVEDTLADRRAQARHAGRQPSWNASPMQWQVGNPGSLHSLILDWVGVAHSGRKGRRSARDDADGVLRGWFFPASSVSIS